MVEYKVKDKVVKALCDLSELPPPDKAPDLYSDWGSSEPFRVKTERGECAA